MASWIHHFHAIHMHLKYVYFRISQTVYSCVIGHQIGSENVPILGPFWDPIWPYLVSFRGLSGTVFRSIPASGGPGTGPGICTLQNTPFWCSRGVFWMQSSSTWSGQSIRHQLQKQVFYTLHNPTFPMYSRA